MSDKFRAGKRVKSMYRAVYGKKSKSKVEVEQRPTLKTFVKTLPEQLVEAWQRAKVPAKGKDQPRRIKAPKPVKVKKGKSDGDKKR